MLALSRAWVKEPVASRRAQPAGLGHVSRGHRGGLVPVVGPAGQSHSGGGSRACSAVALGHIRVRGVADANSASSQARFTLTPCPVAELANRCQHRAAL